MSNIYKIALCQMLVAADKNENFKHAAELVLKAAQSEAEIVCLPEIWTAPYELKRLGEYAEPDDGPTAEFMSDLAYKNGIYLIGGSIPEAAEDGLVYNTSLVYDPDGRQIAKHRKAHLFDINMERGISFRESDFFTAGKSVTVFETKFGKAGLAICFDLRFPDMFREMNAAGAHIVFLPATFNTTTGPAHWDLLLKSRALDNQFYIAACSPARNYNLSYLAWGHSGVAGPWGEYCSMADARETIVYAEIDIDYMSRIRRELPIGN